MKGVLYKKSCFNRLLTRPIPYMMFLCLWKRLDFHAVHKDFSILRASIPECTTIPGRPGCIRYISLHIPHTVAFQHGLPNAMFYIHSVHPENIH